MQQLPVLQTVITASRVCCFCYYIRIRRSITSVVCLSVCLFCPYSHTRKPWLETSFLLYAVASSEYLCQGHRVKRRSQKQIEILARRTRRRAGQRDDRAAIGRKFYDVHVAAGRGHAPRAALCMGRHLEGRKYSILKFGRFWLIGVCIEDSDIFTAL